MNSPHHPTGTHHAGHPPVDLSTNVVDASANTAIIPTNMTLPAADNGSAATVVEPHHASHHVSAPVVAPEIHLKNESANVNVVNATPSAAAGFESASVVATATPDIEKRSLKDLAKDIDHMHADFGKIGKDFEKLRQDYTHVVSTHDLEQKAMQETNVKCGDVILPNTFIASAPTVHENNLKHTHVATATPGAS